MFTEYCTTLFIMTLNIMTRQTFSHSFLHVCLILILTIKYSICRGINHRTAAKPSDECFSLSKS